MKEIEQDFPKVINAVTKEDTINSYSNSWYQQPPTTSKAVETFNYESTSKSMTSSQNVAADDLTTTSTKTDAVVVVREKSTRTESKSSSKRNSLDSKSVQTLAQDLAAECAKAYALMESSLSKLSTDFAVGPFGLTPKKVMCTIRSNTWPWWWRKR